MKKKTKNEIVEEMLVKSGFYRPDQVKELWRDYLKEWRREKARDEDDDAPAKSKRPLHAGAAK
jgi:5'-deoxynucleotidase YfbR-like HD superfamily hydrolase